MQPIFQKNAGAVWHTQGSGKSFTMLFFAARVIRESACRTRVVICTSGMRPGSAELSLSC